MNKALKLNIISYYFSSFFVALAYSLPHSILTILLLEKGVSIAQIALIQSAYSLAILIFELPSGVWADLYSRKMLYILSNLVLAFSFLPILLLQNLYIVVFAYIFYTLLFIYLEYKMNCLFANLVSKQRISALSSAKSSFSRLCAFLIMLISSVFLHYFSVSFVVFFNFLFSMILMLFLVFKFDKHLKN